MGNPGNVLLTIRICLKYSYQWIETTFKKIYLQPRLLTQECSSRLLTQHTELELYYCTTGQLVGHSYQLSTYLWLSLPICLPLWTLSLHILQLPSRKKNLHYNFKTPTPAQTRNAGTSAGIFKHNPHFGFEIPSLKPITHNLLCTKLKVFL